MDIGPGPAGLFKCTSSGLGFCCCICMFVTQTCVHHVYSCSPKTLKRKKQKSEGAIREYADMAEAPSC